MSRYIFFIIIACDIALLLFQTTQLSISYDEAKLVYGDFSFLKILLNGSFFIFGKNDFALRFPMIFLHVSSVLILYKISDFYIKENKDKLWLIFIYILLPGVMSSALVVNSAGLLIFGLFLFVYMYKNKYENIAYFLMIFYSFIESSFLYLFISMLFYGFYSKKNSLIIVSFFTSLISIYFYGIEAYGAPKGHFLDFIGVYSAIFSPIIFIYLVYVLYKVYFIKRDCLDMLWFLAVVAFVISLILSFRQRVAIEHFAPYLLVSLPLVAQTFISSYKIRLRIFRRWYKLAFILSLIFLIVNVFIVLLNKYIYLVVDKPKDNFAYNMHIAKELALKLKKEDIKCISLDSEMMLRLKFYGINGCKSEKQFQNVTVSYHGIKVYDTNVTKINNN